MRTKVILAGLILSLAFVSCKNEDKKDGEVTKTEEVKPETFDVTFDLKIKKDDDLILYYKDGTNEWIVEDKAVWNTVKGSEDFQTVVFSMPEGVIPNDFRFDVGRNEFKGQEPIEIKKITLSYTNKKFEITQDQINTFFKANQYIKYDSATKLYMLQKDEKGGYDPFFEGKPELYPQLGNIVIN